MVIRSAPADCPHCLLEQNIQADGTTAMNLLGRNLNKALQGAAAPQHLLKPQSPSYSSFNNLLHCGCVAELLLIIL